VLAQDPMLGRDPAEIRDLAVLRASGLVATTRTGRFLVHQRTALGVALAGAPAESGLVTLDRAEEPVAGVA
jgi:hypothetical protein